MSGILTIFGTAMRVEREVTAGGVNNNSHQIILAIESSCDDTAASLIVNGKIRSNCVASQLVHEQYGGVVPELASRKHQQNIIPVVDQALKEAGIEQDELSAIACTQGPGLLGSLMVGHTFAKGLSLGLNIPLINVNHLEAHVWAHFIDHDIPEGAFLCLLVSGGHTQFVLMDQGQMTVIGKTLDDAAGEAFDKAGKMLGLAYPSGPLIDQLAKEGNAHAYSFSTSKIGGLDFSFSGLKTSILYFLQKEQQKDPHFIEMNLKDLCASIQHTIVSYLISKFAKAMKDRPLKAIGIAGGVAANSGLRTAVEQLATEHGLKAHIPAFEYCTDNAAMIAQAAWQKMKMQDFGTLNDVCYARYEST